MGRKWSSPPGERVGVAVVGTPVAVGVDDAAVGLGEGVAVIEPAAVGDGVAVGVGLVGG